MEETKISKQNEKLISIIVPLGPGESISPQLKVFLDSLDNNNAIEVIIVAHDHESLGGFRNKFKYTILAHQGTRSSSMNLGAQEANGKYFLFLHGDCYMAKSTFSLLMKRIVKEQTALFYFDFKFYKNSPFYYKFTEMGVWFRCTFLKTPFGDQGLTISKEIFLKIGGYNLKTPIGEDYYLVRACKDYNIKISRIRRHLYTSPRKYQENGWLKTTLYHQKMWYKLISDYRKGTYRK
ncbi:MAG: glycosyltransferase [Firmicutes bacterium]|nr:glycosyltransferase [Bacillota bacterium]